MNTEAATAKNKKNVFEKIVHSLVLWAGYGVLCGLPSGLIIACVAMLQDVVFLKGIFVDYTRVNFLIVITFIFAIFFGLAMLLGRIVFFRLSDEFLRRNYLWFPVISIVGVSPFFLTQKPFTILFFPIAILPAIFLLHYWNRPEKEKSSLRVAADNLVESFAVWLGHGAVFGFLCGMFISVAIFGIVKSDIVYDVVFKDTKYSKDVYALGVIAFWFGPPLGIIALFLARVIFFRLSNEFLHMHRWGLAVIIILSAPVFVMLYVYRGITGSTLMLGIVGVFLCAVAMLWLIQYRLQIREKCPMSQPRAGRVPSVRYVRKKSKKM